MSPPTHEALLLLFDERRQNGEPLTPERFAAEHPGTPGLLTALHALVALDDELDHAAAELLGEHAEETPAVPGYELGATLGRGGSGTVYRARHVATGRVGALKLFRCSTAAVAQRLQRELDLAAQLTHPGIAQLLAAGTFGPSGYIERELIEGHSLRDYLDAARDAPPDHAALRERLTIALAVADALGHAHQHGLVHRDVKPSNVMLDRRLHPKLIDFGLVLPKQPAAARVTRTGVFVGSFNHAAPEQLLGRRSGVGPWTDVYALGLVLFELCTGRAAFAFPSLGARLAHVHARLERTPRALNPHVSRQLERVVQRATHPEPKRRFGDGWALRDALRELL